MSREVQVGNKGDFALVDDQDYEKVIDYAWSLLITKNTKYARYNRRVNGVFFTVRMHTFITGFDQTDHINGNGLDNRRENLREATDAQNSHNRKKFDGVYTSQYKGVHWNKQVKKWQATITLNGKRKHLGLFIKEIEAAYAYDSAAREMHKEYAYLNFRD